MFLFNVQDFNRILWISSTPGAWHGIDSQRPEADPVLTGNISV